VLESLRLLASSLSVYATLSRTLTGRYSVQREKIMQPRLEANKVGPEAYKAFWQVPE